MTNPKFIKRFGIYENHNRAFGPKSKLSCPQFGLMVRFCAVTL